MGKLKLSLLADAMSGKFGGSILSNTANGCTFRQNSYSQQRGTPAQTIQRSKIGQVSQLWRALSTTQKATWSAEIPNYPYTNNVGETAYYSAYQLHNLVNANRQNLNLSFVSNAPAFVPSQQNAVSYIVLGYRNILVGADANAGGGTVIIEATPLVLNTNTPNASAWRQIAQFSGYLIGDSLNIVSSYETVFGSLEPNLNLNLRVKTVISSNGLPSDYYNYQNILLPVNEF